MSNDVGSKLEAVATMSNSSSPPSAAPGGSAPAGDEAGMSARPTQHRHSIAKFSMYCA